jgi:hypothetical protein
MESGQKGNNRASFFSSSNIRRLFMKLLYPAKKHFALAALIVSVALFTGCSMSIKPSAVPLVKGLEPISLSGDSLSITNAEKDSSAYDILNEKGQKLGITANRQAWSRIFIDALAGEMSRRGAQIRAKAPLTLSIALPEITFIQNKDEYAVRVKISVSTSKGWSKTYEAVAKSESGLFESLDHLTARLAGQALSEGIKILISDVEFLAQVGRKQ